MPTKFDSKENLQERFENAGRSGNSTLSREPESPNDAYNIWKEDKGLSDPGDYYWEDGAPSIKCTEEEIRESYDQMLENEDDDDDDD